MYGGHPEDEHDEWLEQKKGWKKRKGTATPDDSSVAASSSTHKLTLSNNFKASMVTKFNCTEEKSNTLWSEVVQNSSVN